MGVGASVSELDRVGCRIIDVDPGADMSSAAAAAYLATYRYHKFASIKVDFLTYRSYLYLSQGSYIIASQSTLWITIFKQKTTSN